MAAPFRFDALGDLAATDGAMERLGGYGVVDMLKRHLRCDWSGLDEHDRKQNELALEQGGGRILSAYDTPGGPVWVITEADRSVTTVLLPEEY